MGVGLNWAEKLQPAWLLAALAFFLPLKPAPVNLLLLLTLLAVLCNPHSRAALKSLLRHPVSLALYALLLWLLLGLALEPGQFSAAQDYLSKYLRLLLLPVLAAAVFTSADRNRVFDWFCAGVFLSVLGSYAVALGWFAQPVGSNSPLLFKLHITHNFFIALALGYLAYRLPPTWPSMPRWGKALLVLAVFLSLYNFLFMVEGRSGWLALALFPVLAVYHRLGFRFALLAAGLVAVTMLAVYWGSDFVQARVNTVFIEVQQWLQGEAIAHDTSSGRRLSFWQHSLQAFAQSPWLGHGLGGFQAAVQPHALAAGFLFEFNNPHNQYLLFAVQGGVVALGLYSIFIIFILNQRKNSHFMLLQAFTLAYLSLNMLNSFHYDFAEGVFFILLVATLAFPVVRGPNA